MLIRKLFSTLAVASLTCVGASAAYADDLFAGKTGALNFTVDGGQTQFKFISDMPAERIQGTAKGVSGSFAVADATKPDTTTGKIDVPVAKMETGNPMRDGHLQSEEWLNAKANPNVSFAIDKVDGVRDVKADGGKSTAAATAHGTFTLNGVGKRMSMPIQITYKDGKLKVAAKFKVSLKDYSIKGKAGVVGAKVGETIDVDCTLYANAR